MDNELLTRFGESKERVVADRELIERLFGDLYKNRVIYHERITILSEVIDIEITDDRYEFRHRPIRLIDADPVFQGMYERWQSYADLVCGSALSLKDHPHIYTCGRLSTAYGAGKIWPGAKRVEFVSNMTEEELRTNFGHIMWNRPILS